mmetsp:Transcript_63366/g.142925  ORF Transcript_63366/g.142925 Transcript_63366/m.142925 type:complete len:241 (-) Transcript_63366:2331-3053(-)
MARKVEVVKLRGGEASGHALPVVGAKAFEEAPVIPEEQQEESHRQLDHQRGQIRRSVPPHVRPGQTPSHHTATVAHKRGRPRVAKPDAPSPVRCLRVGLLGVPDRSRDRSRGQEVGRGGRRPEGLARGLSYQGLLGPPIAKGMAKGIAKGRDLVESVRRSASAEGRAEDGARETGARQSGGQSEKRNRGAETGAVKDRQSEDGRGEGGGGKAGEGEGGSHRGPEGGPPRRSDLIECHHAQ